MATSIPAQLAEAAIPSLEEDSVVPASMASVDSAALDREGSHRLSISTTCSTPLLAAAEAVAGLEEANMPAQSPTATTSKSKPIYPSWTPLRERRRTSILPRLSRVELARAPV